ncbi:MAG: family 10 glycosylhydrolase [Bacteroidales bacterium]|nr:family 10 glycosylhydrolase [Bacteroidales bacterium]
MQKNFFITFIAILLFIGYGCNDDNGIDPNGNGNGNGNGDTPGDTLKIHEFYFHDLNPVVYADIDHEELEITASIPRTANLSKLAVTVEYTEGATLSPPSGFEYNFSQPLSFTLRKGSETLVYTAFIDYSAVDDNELLSVNFPDLFRQGEIESNNVMLEVPFGTDLTEVLIEMEVSAFATVEPPSGSIVDISSPFEIVVTAENGDENTYTLYTTVLDQETGVRAFWIPDPSHTQFLTSYENMQQGVALAKELNFNTLYVVAWAKTRTLYPSQVLADNSTYTDARDGMFTPNYTGVSGDPLQDLISIAHAEGLKVILWYEYGFMARWGTPPTPANDRILAVHPHWIGINNQGQIANYNNSDYYYNAYNPEVQQFMTDLVMEAVNHYDIDGIQGDDRMPAMPRNSGYDEYTINRYKEEHDGEEPPANFNATSWVRWRANILNQFAKDLYDTVKAANPNLLVTNSPNPYPWAFQNLMQEWPVWLDEGVVDIMSVQCYRYNLVSYRATVNEVLYYFNNHGDGNLQRLSPGLILYGSAGLTDAQLIFDKMMYNRSVGITGESFFWGPDPLMDHRIKRVLRAMYPGPAIFPDF